MIYNNYPDDYIVINAKWVEWDNDNECWCFMTEDAFEKAQSLADYTKQVRKEVLGELMNMLGDRAELIQTAENESTFMFDTYDLTMCVEEILGEEVKQNEK